MKLKPNKLKKGDTIAFIAPASGFAALVPHRLEKAKQFFEEKGYKVKIFPTATKNIGLSSDTPENRAKDFNDAFRDSKIKAIICTIGGNSSHQILEYLDADLIKKNPKIFCGYSDITSLHFFLNKICNLVTFYGPTVIPEFGETLNLEKYTVEYFFKAVANSEPIGEVKPSKKWTDFKELNWLEKEDLKIERKYKLNKGYEWLKKGKSEGEIMGGCITSMMHTRGTKYWPDFEGNILLLETPEGESFDKGESIANIDAFLTDLRISNVFEKIKGIVFGRGFGYNEDDLKKLKGSMLENSRGNNFPILFNVDIGHSDPKITIPLGVKVSLDSEKNCFTILESGVK
ncbi:MAG: S66 peptidase family protein [Candidatus Woesearchaeota archaeon]